MARQERYGATPADSDRSPVNRKWFKKLVGLCGLLLTGAAITLISPSFQQRGARVEMGQREAQLTDLYSRTHRQWTESQLREEVERISKLLDAVDEFEKRHEAHDETEKRSISEMVNRSLEAMFGVHKNVLRAAQDEKTVFEEKARKYSQAIDKDMQLQIAEERREDVQARDVMRILITHRGEINWEALLAQARMHHIMAYSGSTIHDEKVAVHRINIEEAKGNKHVNRHIEELLSKVRRNVTALKASDGVLAKKINHMDEEEKSSFATTKKEIQSQIDELAAYRKQTIDTSAEIDQVDRDIGEMQEDLSKTSKGTSELGAKASRLEEHVNGAHDKIKNELSKAEEHIESIRGNLAGLVSLSTQVAATLKTETDAHTRIASKEKEQMGTMNQAVSDMEPQLQTVLSLSDQVSTLQGQVNSKLQAFESKYKAIKDKQNGMSATSSTISDEIKDAMEKVNALETQDDSGDVQDGYKDLHETLKPVAAELVIVEGLKEELSALDDNLAARIKALGDDAASLTTERSEWEVYIDGEHKALQQKLTAQIKDEQQRMASVAAGLDGMGADVNASKAFRARAEQVLRQLKTQLADTSQSLLVVDRKYSGQMEAVSEELRKLRLLHDDVADPDAMSEGADQVEVRAEGVLNSLDDVKEQIKRSRQQEQAQARRQVELKKRLRDVTKQLASAITLANNHIQRHPDLIERVSCTCYDGYKLNGVCLAGSMLDESTCDPCPEGSYCTRGGENPCKTTCPSGQELKGLCPAGSSTDTTTCEECSAGVFCTDGRPSPCKTTCAEGEELVGECPAGSVADTTSCRPCPVGFFCVDGKATECKTTCADGEQLSGACNVGATEDTTKCQACLEGFFCMDGEAVPCTKTCRDGKQLTGSCPVGSTSDTTACEECPADHFCHGGDAFPCKDTCEAGLVLSGSCTAGSRRDTIRCKPCPRGMFCVDGVASPCKTTCDAGQELIGQCRKGSGSDLTECVACPAEHYCQDGERDACKPKCLNGLELVGECPEGSVEDTSECLPCPAGHYCRDAFPPKACRTTCPAGQLLEGECAAGSKRDVTRCTWCDRGFYCQEGVAHPCKTECPAGQVLTGTCRKASPEDMTTCEPCPGGKFCAGGQVKQCKTTCPDGQFLDGFCEPGSEEDTTECKVCPAGSYCKDGKKKECVSTCRKGQQLVGECVQGSKDKVTECVPCPEGFYCGGTDGKAMECTSSCIDGKQLRGECEIGEKSDEVQCVPCPEGMFCADGETKTCQTTCEAGLLLVGHCSAGSLQDTTSCSPCPEGMFCTDGEAHRCKTTCDPGKQLNGQCSLGSSSDVTTCDPCPAGFFCTNGRPSACKAECPDGQTVQGECKEGSIEDLDCVPCPAGTYCAAGQMSACKESCDDGKELVGFCTAGSTSDSSGCHDCHAGSFCTGGEAHPCKLSCPAGQELQGTCAPGATSDTTTCVDCPAGYFCDGGQKFECHTTCPNGKILVAQCVGGAQQDVNTCNPCPEGSFCMEGEQYACKTECPDGEVLSGSCGVGSAADTTVCGPCPAGAYCSGGAVAPCKTTCTAGNELVGFCSAGSTEDTTECVPCPPGSFCTDGIASPCRSTCPAGEVFGGECTEGAASDKTTCSECTAGFYCQNGVQVPCRTECPSTTQELRGECAAGSVRDMVQCKTSGTPPPMPIKWWTHRTDYKGTEPPEGQPHGLSMLRLTSGTSGHIQGSVPLPIPGASWTVHFYVGWPDYDSKQDEHGFPKESVGEPGVDTIKVNINGQEKTLSTSSEFAGKMQIVMEQFEGEALIFRFDFSSSSTDPMLHPFVSTGEVTLNHDSTTSEEGQGIGTGTGEFKGKAINAIDGKTVKPGPHLLHDGYEKRAMEVKEEITLLLFQDSTLIQKVEISRGKWRMRKIAAGEYTCIGTARGFAAFFSDQCVVQAGDKTFINAVFSPWLRPGSARTILTWGALPRDLDSYLLVPHKEEEEPPCEVSWVNKECHSGAVELDLDQMSGYGPETITILKFREGKYRFRVSEYKGKEDNKEALLLSHAQVSVFTESTGSRFSISKDGFIKGRNWYVFTIDGATRRVLPCSEDTCGHGYHDAKGLGNG